MTVKLIIFSLLLASYVHASPQDINGAWKGFSEPEIMASGFTHSFNALPLEGAMAPSKKGWSGHYWPTQKGSINYRWNTPEPRGFGTVSPSRAEVMSMSPEAIALLAPSEKYDLYMGNYDYPTKKAASNFSNAGASDWAGLCHGWAPAALNHNEPTPKVVTNPDGIQIPFGSTDIKALVSFYYAFIDDSSDMAHQVGLRCFFGSWLGGARGCGEDLNAGAFHIVAANMLGLRKEGFLSDVDRYKEVWNQPVVGYKTTILADNLKPEGSAARTAVKEMRVATEFFYVDESEILTWDVAFGTKEQKISKKDLVYRLEINAAGQIVGGEWESEVRPDFLWNKGAVKEFKGMMSLLPNLLND